MTGTTSLTIRLHFNHHFAESAEDAGDMFIRALKHVPGPKEYQNQHLSAADQSNRSINEMPISSKSARLRCGFYSVNYRWVAVLSQIESFAVPTGSRMWSEILESSDSVACSSKASLILNENSSSELHIPKFWFRTSEWSKSEMVQSGSKMIENDLGKISRKFKKRLNKLLQITSRSSPTMRWPRQIYGDQKLENYSFLIAIRQCLMYANEL